MPLLVHVIVVLERRPEVQASVVAQELDVAGLEDVINPQVGAARQLVEQLDRLVLRLGQTGNLWVPLGEEVVVVAEVDAEETLEEVEDGHFVEALLPRRDLALAVPPPSLGLIHDGGQLRRPLDHLVVDRDRGGPRRTAALLGRFEAQQRDQVGGAIIVPGLGDVGGIKPRVWFGGVMTDVFDVADQVPLFILRHSLRATESVGSGRIPGGRERSIATHHPPVLPDEPICYKGLAASIAADRNALEQHKATAERCFGLHALELGAKERQREIGLLCILRNNPGDGFSTLPAGVSMRAKASTDCQGWKMCHGAMLGEISPEWWRNLLVE